MATIHGALKALASLKFPLITRVVGVTDDNTFLPRLCCVPLCCVLKLDGNKDGDFGDFQQNPFERGHKNNKSPIPNN